MGREENIAVFQDTEHWCRTNQRLKEGIAKSVADQKLILEWEGVEDAFQGKALDKNRYKNVAKVVVSKKRSYEAASAYQGKRVCVHNFASASNPGGGVTRGSSAQEECLCRCSTLYFCLNTEMPWESFYGPHRAAHDPIHNDDCIYTPGVTVIKTDEAIPRIMPEKDWYEVSVITCAAPNLRENPSNQMNSGDGQTAVKLSSEEQVTIHEKRLRRILDVAVATGEEVVILGAFGCGAFQNDPQAVATAAGNVLADYMHAFETIEFAVYCSPRDERNYDIFKQVISGK
ncbi:MAG: TIGR02452 family protein [Lachnospiraceae bacterium]|nr:TIGR02452 family protein [Lachnospiraceae bacterium]